QTIAEIEALTGARGYSMTGYDDGTNQFSLMYSNIDSSYIDVMGLQILEGDYIHEARKQGIANGVIVNQTFLRESGLKENVIGTLIPFDLYGMDNAVITGVVRDFYSGSPGFEVRPMLFFDNERDRQNFRILVKSSSERAVLEEKMSAAWDAIFDPIPFDYEYLAIQQRERFEQEDKISSIAGIGSILAIFISAFGLLGLVGLTIQKKLKELSIRRVMGASDKHIIVMMIKKFAIPIVISLVAGISISFYLTEQWLTDYHNRISFGWEHGTIAAMSVIFILALIVTLQTIKVTRTNPVVHLKDE
ncbi:MAG: FtsX-like permease family protein, partial [Bacteroidota bacterium]